MESNPGLNAEASFTAVAEQEGLGWAKAGARWRDFFRAEPEMEMAFEFIWHDVSGRSASELTMPNRSGTVELWLNFTGRALIIQRGGAVELPPNASAVFAGKPRQVRLDEKRHEFILVRFTTAFLLEHFANCLEDLPPSLKSALHKSSPSAAKPLLAPLSHHQRNLVRRLACPPGARNSRRLWYASRAFELMLAFLITREEPLAAPPPNGHRTRERVERVKAILQAALASPPPLAELARQVGGSPFYLSRQFRAETGITIPQFIQQHRMERAVEMLRAGAGNVSETAAAVGYRSASHFTTTFQQKFGCLPSHVATLPPAEAANILSLHS
jgi:AraC-like DNA-binding protein